MNIYIFSTRHFICGRYSSKVRSWVILHNKSYTCQILYVVHFLIDARFPHFCVKAPMRGRYSQYVFCLGYIFFKSQVLSQFTLSGRFYIFVLFSRCTDSLFTFGKFTSKFILYVIDIRFICGRHSQKN